jgi:cell division septation protein DedD
MSEQEVHEIQLNGKQLVFMFMAATVVSVVIFLCGVMVGRGVRQPVTTFALNTETAVDPTAQSEPAPPDPALTTDSAAAPVQEKLTYAERLESVSAPRDNALKSPAPTEKPQVATAVADQETPAKVVPAKETTPKEAVKTSAAQKVSAVKPTPVTASASLAEPPGKGWMVQVMALPTRGDADALAQRLNGKGYPTFVAPNSGAASLKYRVRVGKYNTKAEADAVANRLKQQERFKPWVTR